MTDTAQYPRLNEVPVFDRTTGEKADALPVCLREDNPRWLVSLWDMLLINSQRFVTLLGDLRRLEHQLEKDVGLNDGKAVGITLACVTEDCKKLNLISSTKQLERIGLILEHATREISGTDLLVMFSELRRRVEEDLEESVFYQVEPEQMRLCFARSRANNLTEFSLKTAAEFFDAKVVASFPSAADDIAEACRCLAFGRNTACVFHLMRVLELGLTPLGAVFNVSLAHTNWAPAIDQIESGIRKMSSDPNWTAQPDWKDQQEFYSQAASHFRILKDAWRNYTAHARGKYDDREASDIVVGIRSFMEKLATRLHE